MMQPSEDTKTRVLVVESSPVLRRILVDLIGAAPDLSVAGEAANGVDAIRYNRSLNPDIIIMNLDLPLMSGLQATEVMMQECPNRIVLFGDAAATQDNTVISRVHASGALDLCQKPRRATDDPAGEHLVKTLRALSKVGVVKRHRQPIPTTTDFEAYPGMKQQPEVVLIVSSTGGPQAIGVILQQLPADFPLPMIIVQHIGQEFIENMVSWLSGITPLRFKVAEHGERPLPGTVYLAPIGKHLRIAFNGQLLLDADPDGRRHIPSGDVLFESGAEVYGTNAIGVILSGMGEDGAAGLLKLRQLGAPTIAQDESTSVVYGMPQEAVNRGAAQYVEPITSIANLLVALAQKGQTHE